MSRYEYRLPDIPPSNNKFIGRENRWEYQKIKKQWALLISVACCPKPPAPIERAMVHIKYHFKDRIRRDPDNYSGKMILDGLVRAGILSDDSFFCVELKLSADFGNKSDENIKGTTEISIEEVKQIV